MAENDKPKYVLPELPPPSDDMPDKPLSGKQKLWLFTLVAFKRIRFIAILAAVGLFIGYWDTVKNHWDKWTRPHGAIGRELAHGEEFYCPMDPQVVRSTYEPNGSVPKCPICGMPLSMRAKGEVVALPEGITSRVQLTPERVQLAGIETVAVSYRPSGRETQTVGYITFDEGRMSRVVSRVDGYVEKLYVDTTYAVVHQGDPLLEIYSPELYSAAKELLLAAQNKALANMEASARAKLRLLGVGEDEIDGIIADGHPSARLVIRSPQSGYVVEKKVVVGASVEAKMTLLEVADLTTVWVEAEVYEKDIQYVHVGQPVEATVESLPNRTFAGKVALVYPRVEAATRTNRLRIVLDNADKQLRPGMFAAVRMSEPPEPEAPRADGERIALTSLKNGGQHSGQSLVVPQRAVIDTGSKKVVYVERKPGLFEGVAVELGPRNGEFYPVLKGLKEGDKVAAAGAFLIDAETRLNPAAASTYFGASGMPQAAASMPAKSGSSAGASPAAPAKAPSRVPVALSVEQLKNVEQLPEGDRQAALAQRVCPVTDKPLGSMGVPVKITLRDQAVFLCCKGCLGKAKRSPDEILAKLGRGTGAKP